MLSELKSKSLGLLGLGEQTAGLSDDWDEGDFLRSLLRLRPGAHGARADGDGASGQGGVRDWLGSVLAVLLSKPCRPASFDPREVSPNYAREIQTKAGRVRVQTATDGSRPPPLACRYQRVVTFHCLRAVLGGSTSYSLLRQLALLGMSRRASAAPKKPMDAHPGIRMLCGPGPRPCNQCVMTCTRSVVWL